MANDLNFEQNASGVYVPTTEAKKLRSFYGRVVDQMPLLLSGKDEEGRVVDVPRTPMTPKQIVLERVKGQDNNDRKLLRANYVFTPHAVCFDPDSDEVTLAPYSDRIIAGLMNGLNAETELDRGAIFCDTDTYQEIKRSTNSYTLSGDVANALRDDYYSQVKAREGAWDHILEGNSELRKDNLKLVQRITGGGTMVNRMALVLPPKEYKGIRPLVVGAVGDYSDASGDDDLDDDDGRLIGVAPEAQSRENGASLENQILAIVGEYLGERPMADVKTRLMQLYAQHRQ